MLNFLLETQNNSGGGWITIVMLAGFMVLMYFFMHQIPA